MASAALIKTVAALALIGLVLGGVGVLMSYEQVPEGHEGVTTQWGAVTGETLDSGAHWKTPIAQSVREVEVRPRTYTMAADDGEGKKGGNDAVVVQTVNGTSVAVDVTVRYHINESSADDFVREWNQEQQMEHRLIRPTVRSQLRDEAAAIPSSSIYTDDGRERLQLAAVEALNEQFSNQPIVLEAVQIREVDMPQSYDKALNQKEIAKQQIEQEQYDVQAEQERKKQKVIQAEADAASIRERASAYEENPVMVEVERIEAMKDGSVFVVPKESETPIIMDGNNASTAGATG